jgi:hypothetical protein
MTIINPVFTKLTFAGNFFFKDILYGSLWNCDKSCVLVADFRRRKDREGEQRKSMLPVQCDHLALSTEPEMSLTTQGHWLDSLDCKLTFLKLVYSERFMITSLYYTKKCTILNTYETFKLSLQHVWVHYIPSSESVIILDLKSPTNKQHWLLVFKVWLMTLPEDCT